MPDSASVRTCARAGCARTFPARGKRRFCSPAHQVAAWRAEHAAAGQRLTVDDPVEAEGRQR